MSRYAVNGFSRARAWLELSRPANIVTAFADILAGVSIAGGGLYLLGGSPVGLAEGTGWLLLATFGLYGGGVVLNDVFDAELDQMERPERPIPSGRVTVVAAAIYGAGLLLLGLMAALQVSMVSGGVALAVIAAILIYDIRAKKGDFTGPLVMGLCRSGNLLLGMSVVPSALIQTAWIGLMPLLYIFAVTLVSRGEVHGGSEKFGNIALLLLLLVYTQFFLISYLVPDFHLAWSLVVLAIHLYIVVPPFLKVATDPTPERCGLAVKTGIISLITLNAALAAGFSGPVMAILILFLLPLAKVIARSMNIT
ncbi:MAG: UbiA-like protein EboC [Balneolaceae bacterium]